MELAICFLALIAGMLAAYIWARGAGWIGLALFSFLSCTSSAQVVIQVENQSSQTMHWRLYNAANRPTSDWWYWTSGSKAANTGPTQAGSGSTYTPYAVFWYASDPAGLGANQSSPGTYLQMDQFSQSGTSTYTGAAPSYYQYWPALNFTNTSGADITLGLGCEGSSSNGAAILPWSWHLEPGQAVNNLSFTNLGTGATAYFFDYTTGNNLANLGTGSIGTTSGVVTNSSHPSVTTYPVVPTVGSYHGGTGGTTNGASQGDIYMLGGLLSAGNNGIISAIRSLGTNLAGLTNGSGQGGSDYTNLLRAISTNTAGTLSELASMNSNWSGVLSNFSALARAGTTNDGFQGLSNAVYNGALDISNQVQEAGGSIRSAMGDGTNVSLGSGDDMQLWGMTIRTNLQGAMGYIPMNPLSNPATSWLFTLFRNAMKFLIMVIAILYVLSAVRDHADIVVQMPGRGLSKPGLTGIATWLLGAGVGSFILLSLPILLIGALDTTLIAWGYSTAPFGNAAEMLLPEEHRTKFRAIMGMVDGLLPLTVIMGTLIYLTVFDVVLFGHLVFAGWLREHLGN